MKKNVYLPVIAALAISALVAGCKEPDNGGTKKPEIVVSTSLDAFNEKYDLNMQLLALADTVEWRNNGDVDLVTTYTVTTEAKALELANFLEKEVFPLFGDEFIANVMPPKIYIADAVYYTYSNNLTDVNPDWTPKKAADMGLMDLMEMMDNTSSEDVNVPLYGEVSNYHLTLATNHLADADKTALMKGYVSLIIERMMANTSKWPEPTEFIKVSEDAHDIVMNNDINPGNSSAKNNSFYQTSLASTRQKTLYYAGVSNYDPKFSIWWFCGALNPNRYGPIFYEGYTAALCEQYNWAYDLTGDDQITVDDNYYWFRCMTYQQDFGDFVAHILFDSPAVKEALYARVDAASWDNKDMDTGEIIATRKCDSQLMKQKVELVKTYFKTNFDITLPDAE